MTQTPRIPLNAPLMDADHARVEALFDRAAGVGEGELVALAGAIRRELAAHFAVEEEMMRAAAAPALECHVAQHAMLLAQADEAVRLAPSGDLRRRLAQELPALVLSHVASLDRMAARFLNGELTPDATAALRLPIPEKDD